MDKAKKYMRSDGTFDIVAYRKDEGIDDPLDLYSYSSVGSGVASAAFAIKSAYDVLARVPISETTLYVQVGISATLAVATSLMLLNSKYNISRRILRRK